MSPSNGQQSACGGDRLGSSADFSKPITLVGLMGDGGGGGGQIHTVVARAIVIVHFRRTPTLSGRSDAIPAFPRSRLHFSTRNI